MCSPFGAPILCSGATRTLYAPSAAHHVCLLQSARKLCKQRFPVAAALSHGTSVRGDGGPVHLHHAALSFLVHVLFTFFCGRGALVVRRADTCALPACGGGGGGSGASAAFLGCIVYRSFVESAHFLLIPWVCSSTCGGLTSSARLVAGRPACLDFPRRLRLQQLPPCER